LSKNSPNVLIPAHGPGGELSALMPKSAAEFQSLKFSSVSLPDLFLTRRQLCDIECLLNGAFSPLTGFMNQADYLSVVNSMRLENGILFPLPIVLDVNEKTAERIKSSNTRELALKDEEGNIIAILTVGDIYKPDLKLEADFVFGGDPEHPAINYLTRQSGEYYIGGELTGLQFPAHYDHKDLRLTPEQTRQYFIDNNWRHVTAFQTRNPLHRAHYELTIKACKENDSALLLHPVVGMTKPGDIDHHTRVKCYRAIMGYYQEAKVPALLAALPLAMRMCGPREALWHAIIRQNYGASHFILGRDHAGPGKNSSGKDFYGPYEARDLALKFQNELKIKLTPFDMMLYVPSTNSYATAKTLNDSSIKTESLSGTEVRRRLETGEEIPAWFSFPTVVKILRSVQPPKIRQGYCVFFTGLSGSGKSTIANALLERLMSIDTRMLTLLDGDHVRQMLSSELGFSSDHRNLNICRIGYVSSLIVKSGGGVIAAPIAPYTKSREFARAAVSQYGGFIEVYVSAPVDVCEKRDRKGLYAKARSGLLKHFTGIDDPYQPPVNPTVKITPEQSVEQAVEVIVEALHQAGYLAKSSTSVASDSSSPLE